MFEKFYFKQNLLGGDVGAGGAGEAGDGDTGADTSGAGTPDADGGSTSESKGDVSFPDGLSQEIMDDPSLKVFIGEDNKINYGNLMKSYVNAQKMVGADKTIIPGENSSEQDWADFFNKVRPADLEKYEVKANLPEGHEVDKDMVDAYKEQAHKSGMLPKQAQNLLDWFNTRTIEAVEANKAQMQEEYDSELNALKKEWGEGFDKQSSLANNALKHFVEGNLLAEFHDAGLSDNVTMLKVFNKIGAELLGEDSFKAEAKGSFGMTPEQANEKIGNHMSDPAGAYLNADHADHARVVEEVRKLSEVAYG